MVSKSFVYRAVKLSIPLVAVITIILLIPFTRLMLLGLIRHESFYKGRPISYWIKALRDPNVETRKTAAYALWDMNSTIDRPAIRLSSEEITDSVSALTEALSDEDATVRGYAADALG